ncbi:GntR family transcriptional regulator [Nitratireductor sp. GISD-1A_MAKvit]|uniref:FadR/GntR family transcriptional regulator n=1 Tax=Nitratireductor sp. GISD-1A_MAKvit TaxID=3234198 RepID=UPI003467B153
MLRTVIDADSLPPLHAPTVVDVTVEYFENLIVSGALHPGALLPSERRLAESLDVSRVSLRSAIAKLSAKGVLIADGRTTAVTNVSAALISAEARQTGSFSAADAWEFWSFLSVEAAAIATERHTRVDSVSLDQSQTHLLTGNWDEAEEQTDRLLNYLEKVCATAYNFFYTQVYIALNTALRPIVANRLGEIGKETELRQSFVSSINDAHLCFINRDREGLRDAFAALCSFLEPGKGDVIRFPTSEHTTSASRAQAMSQLVEHFRNSAMSPGQTLPSVETLAQATGIATTALREAIAALDALEVVRIDKKEVVSLLRTDLPDSSAPLLSLILKRPDAVRQVYEFREVLEVHASYMAARNSGADIAPMRAELKQALEISEEQYAQADVKLHNRIAHMCGNTVAAIVSDALMPIFLKVTQEWFRLHSESYGDLDIIHRQHEEIVNAIEARDSASAADAMGVHLNYVVQAMRAAEERDRLMRISTLRSHFG